MSDERLKEIKEELAKISFSNIGHCVNTNLILDYITNLQEEIERLNNIIKEISKENQELKEKTKLFHKNRVFSLEYDKETLRDMVLELQEQKKQIKIWLKEQSERLHNIAGDNFTTVGQAVYEEVLKKIEEIENAKNRL